MPEAKESNGWSLSSSLSGTVEDAADIINCCEVSQEGHEVGQFGVVRIVEPGRYRDSVVGMEDVRCRRIIQDDCIAYWTTQLRQILSSPASAKAMYREGSDMLTLT